MKLLVTPSITDNRYSVIIKFKSFGSTTLTDEQEKKVIDDYSPSFKLSDLTFEGKYKADGSPKKVVADSSGHSVTLSVPNKSIKIDDTIELGYTIHANEIAQSETGGTLTTVDLVAQAKTQLFVDVISKKIGDTIKNLSANLNKFEEEYDLDVG